MKDLLREYVTGFVVQTQNPGPLHSLGGVPIWVYCPSCITRSTNNYKCSDCADTRRAQIPWAEVMNAR